MPPKSLELPTWRLSYTLSLSHCAPLHILQLLPLYVGPGFEICRYVSSLVWQYLAEKEKTGCVTFSWMCLCSLFIPLSAMCLSVIVVLPGLEVIKLFFMLKSIKHEIYPAHKC